MRRAKYVAEYDRLRSLLVACRLKAGMSQEELGALLFRPQSFVSKYERGERRLDVVEFVVVARALGCDPAAVFASLLRDRS